MTKTGVILKTHITEGHSIEKTNVYALTTKRRLVVCSCNRKFWTRRIDITQASA